MLENIEKSLFEIKKILLDSPLMCSIVYNDSNNALNDTPPIREEVDSYISFNPVVDFTIDNDKNCAIVIGSNNFQKDDIGWDSVVTIRFIYPGSKAELVNGRLRQMVFAREVERLLDQKKLSASNKLELSGFNAYIISEKLCELDAVFNLYDGHDEF